MRTILTLCLLTLYGQCTSQITAAEYFIDSDPGIQNGESITITPDLTIDEGFNVSTDGINPGFHRLYVRVKDSSGNWSLYDQQGFHVSPPAIPAPIMEAEYFIDTDPGVGNATQLSVSEGFTIAEEIEIDTEGLDIGFHTLYLRVKDSNEGWTLYDKQGFHVQGTGPIIAAEYFIDSDPGLGNGVEIPIQSGFNIYEETQLATLGLTAGTHLLYVRVMDSNDVWSVADTAEFTILLVDGLSDHSTFAFVLYPNPAVERLNVNTETRIQELSIYDAQGALVKQLEGNHYEIDVSDLAAGNYVLEVIASDERHHFKFIKDL